jgi:hypothetical protein
MGFLRTILALLVTPLLSPLAGLLIYAIHSGGLPPAFIARSSFRYYGVLAYVVTAAFGVPAFLLLRRSRFGGKLSAAACGGIIALATAAALFALVPLFFTADNVEGYITWSLTGALSGLVFWVIAAGRKANERAAAKSNNGMHPTRGGVPLISLAWAGG